MTLFPEPANMIEVRQKVKAFPREGVIETHVFRGSIIGIQKTSIR